MRNRHFYFISMILLGLVVSNCSEMKDEFAPTNENETQEVTAATRAMGDGKYQVLGYGYDILENI